MSKRAPLALVYIAYLKEWRAVQTGRSTRGCEVEAVIYCRNPTDEERGVMEAACLDRSRHFYLGDLLAGEAEEALARWNIPMPTGEGIRVYTGYLCPDCDGFGTRPVHPGTDDTSGECHRCQGDGWLSHKPDVEWEVESYSGTRAQLKAWARGPDPDDDTMALVRWRDSLALDWWGEDLVSHIERAFESPVRPIPEEHQVAHARLMGMSWDRRHRLIKKALMGLGSY